MTRTRGKNKTRTRGKNKAYRSGEPLCKTISITITQTDYDRLEASIPANERSEFVRRVLRRALSRIVQPPEIKAGNNPQFSKFSRLSQVCP